MKIERTEIRTGLFVVVTLVTFVLVLIYLGSPGVFVAQKHFRVYFDNAAGIKPGAEVLLAGRKIGRVKNLYSPVPEEERPTPTMEAMVVVEVEASAIIYETTKVSMTQPALLGDLVIDFTDGHKESGMATSNHAFIGERPPGVAEAVPSILAKLDPVLAHATATFDSLTKTSDNLAKITAEGADLPAAMSQFRQTGANLNKLTGPDGPLNHALTNVELMTGDEGKLDKALDNILVLTGPDSHLSNTFANSDKFTSKLSKNKDIDATLRNFRRSSEQLHSTLSKLDPTLTNTGANLEKASDTLKHQPWRLIWPSTKTYPEDKPPLKTTTTTPAPAPAIPPPRSPVTTKQRFPPMK